MTSIIMLDVLTSRRPTELEYFYICAARAILQNMHSVRSQDEANAARAVAAAVKWGVIDLNLSAMSFGKHVGRIAAIVSFYRTVEHW